MIGAAYVRCMLHFVMLSDTGFWILAIGCMEDLDTDTPPSREDVLAIFNPDPPVWHCPHAEE